MTFHLTIITGSSRGLGAALVAQRLLPGHAVLGIARQTNGALQARADADGLRFEQWPLDLADSADAAQRLAQWLGSFDSGALASATLINNAGMVGTLAPLDRVPLAEICAGLRVGLEAAMLLCASFLDATRTWPGQRRVLNISSGLGRHAMAGSAVYCAAKAGMDHFSRAVALEQADQANPARVVSMAPGVIDTDMQAALRGSDAALFPERARFVKLQSDGALLSPQDCAARLLARLDRADFGSTVVADIREG
jgi:NAD(P)-dependent dehydrogenase (short-subunit alcohol dehydrogenase family)